ncbi:hypothetical protein GCK72_015250 [Caenorhabditis remanei]|uniref:Uncharacterized protein n=1 Tax=Caenorhabditis remanei TaxID=31234 RepID=A0A6A5GTJ7_CAERE|nr:hypothetical protein GCK72_015250 [Caenorhabditis remanei]KAF1758790.1 hypothetical protein GCK72_015250 [Caenorhabditis remanei]
MGTNGVDSEKFRKQMTVSKLCGFQKATRILPLTMNPTTEDVEVKDVKMTTSFDEKGIATNYYSVTWIDVAENKKADDGLGLKKTVSATKIQEGLKTGKIQCDGPCGQKVNLADVVQFGCDHMICDKCRRSQTSNALFDGSPGCCHAECLEKATHDGLKLRSGRRLDSLASSVSLRSNDGPWEVLAVHVCIVKKFGNHVYRTKLDYEFPSQTRIAELTKVLAPYHETIADGRVYYSMRRPKTCDELYPISLTDTNLRFYHLSEYKPLRSGRMYVMVIGDGVQLY